MTAETDTRQRLDYETLPDGSVKAILTVSLPGGIVKRFEAVTSAEEAQSVEGDIVGAELALNPGHEVGWNPFKAVAKLAKKVVNSKVFKVAATGLAVAAPLLGPIAPAALGAAAAMGVASKLAKAGVAAAKGAKKVSQALTASAARDAKKLTRTPRGAAQLLAVANRRRLGAEALAEGKPKRKPLRFTRKRAKPRKAAAPTAPALAAAPAKMGEGELLKRARLGRVRSNKRGAVTDRQLLQAHRAGRIYWVS